MLDQRGRVSCSHLDLEDDVADPGLDVLRPTLRLLAVQNRRVLRLHVVWQCLRLACPVELQAPRTDGRHLGTHEPTCRLVPDIGSLASRAVCGEGPAGASALQLQSPRPYRNHPVPHRGADTEDAIRDLGVDRRHVHDHGLAQCLQLLDHWPGARLDGAAHLRRRLDQPHPYRLVGVLRLRLYVHQHAAQTADDGAALARSRLRGPLRGRGGRRGSLAEGGQGTRRRDVGGLGADGGRALLLGAAGHGHPGRRRRHLQAAGRRVPGRAGGSCGAVLLGRGARRRDGLVVAARLPGLGGLVLVRRHGSRGGGTSANTNSGLPAEVLRAGTRRRTWLSWL
mmetsp:Transcript_67087/g.190350  ORF Transcript_67087/g.190350 Transcript_67087/m.190350 type:complete len:338 (+) Transcript_67087:886-1899(+)